MHAVDHASAGALLTHAGPMLEAHEAENALVLGLLASPPQSMTAPPMWMSLEGATSNGIYRRVGYRLIGESRMVAFEGR